MTRRRQQPQNKAKAAKPEPEQSGTTWTPRSHNGTRVTQDNALTFSAVWDCVKIISETLAVMPWRHMRRLPKGGSEKMSESVIDWLLFNQPNPEMTAFVFKELMASWVLTWGNGYAEIERDNAGRILWFWPLTPDRVSPVRLDDGSIWYEVKNFGRDPSYLRQADVLHFRGLGFNGLVGYSVIDMAAKSIGVGLDMEDDNSAFYANRAAPSGVLKYPKPLSEEAAKKLRERWDKKHSGAKNVGRTVLLEDGMEWSAMGLPQRDAQFIENRTFQINEIARWYRIPPHMLGEMSRSTFANIEQQSISFVTDTMLPWICRFEQEANHKMFGMQQRGTNYTKFNLNAIMRGDSESRSKFYRSMWDMGALSVNEIRELEDQNPIGPDGDKRLVQLNLTTLEKVGEDPVVPAQASTDSVQPPANPPRQAGGDAQDDGEANRAKEINIVINMPPFPEIKVPVKIDSHNNVTIPEMPAPTVNVAAPTVQVAPAQVTVDASTTESHEHHSMPFLDTEIARDTARFIAKEALSKLVRRERNRIVDICKKDNPAAAAEAFLIDEEKTFESYLTPSVNAIGRLYGSPSDIAGTVVSEYKATYFNESKAVFAAAIGGSMWNDDERSSKCVEKLLNLAIIAAAVAKENAA